MQNIFTELEKVLDSNEKLDLETVDTMGFMHCGAVILAGGKGTRFLGEKQFFTLNRKPLWRHVYDKMLAYLSKKQIVVVGVDIPGGETRSQSVRRGLEYLSELGNIQKVIILEAARPLVTLPQIESLLLAFHTSNTFVMPLVNTVIHKSGSFMDRDQYLDLLTPQSFDFSLLWQAYCSGKYVDMTDETRVMYEEYGIKPCFLEGAENLMKVTYPKDLPIIKYLAKEQKRII